MFIFHLSEEVVRDTSLSPNAKILYANIISYRNNKKQCFVSNAAWADLFQISTRQVRTLLKELSDQKYIEIIISENRQKRSIRVPDFEIEFQDTEEENFPRRRKKTSYVTEEKNFPHNNTSLKESTLTVHISKDICLKESDKTVIVDSEKLPEKVQETKSPILENYEWFRISDHEKELVKKWYRDNNLPAELIKQAVFEVDLWLANAEKGSAAWKARTKPTHYRYLYQTWVVSNASRQLKLKGNTRSDAQKQLKFDVELALVAEYSSYGLKPTGTSLTFEERKLLEQKRAFAEARAILEGSPKPVFTISTGIDLMQIENNTNEENN